MRRLCCALFVSFAATAASAAEPSQLGVFDAWSAHMIAEGKNRICYVHGAPGVSRGDYTRRGATYLQVTNRTADRTRNEVSLVAGYTYKTDSAVALDIDGRKFEMFTRDDGAWTRNEKSDAALVAAMRAGKSLVLRGISSRGTETTDTYSLKGFTAAHNAIGKACRIR